MRFNTQEELKKELSKNCESDANEEPGNSVLGLTKGYQSPQKGRYWWKPKPERDLARPNLDPDCWIAVYKTARLATIVTPTQIQRTISRVRLTAIVSSHLNTTNVP